MWEWDVLDRPRFTSLTTFAVPAPLLWLWWRWEVNYRGFFVRVNDWAGITYSFDSRSGNDFLSVALTVSSAKWGCTGDAVTGV